MCPVQEMQKFALRHQIENYEAVPQVIHQMAHARGVDIDTFLKIVESKPDLSEFVARIVENF